MNDVYNINVNAKYRGMGSLLWEVIGAGFNASKFDLSVTIYDSLYTNDPKDNMWDNYFEPINNINKIDYGIKLNDYSHDLKIFYNLEEKTNWNRFYKDRIVFKKDILDDLKKYYDQYFLDKKIIGVHYRSTDIYSEFNRLKKIDEKYNKASVEMYFNEIDKLTYDYVYLATDSSQIFEQFVNRHPNVISYATMRSDNDSGIHYIANDRIKHGKEVLIETLLMSKCDYLLHGQNNMPAVVHIINPNIKFKNLDYNEGL